MSLSAVFKLLPVSLEDGPGIVRAQQLGFADDAFNRASFPKVSLEVKIEDAVERWPANFSVPGSIYMKSVHKDTGEIIGYSKWQADATFTSALKEKFGTNTAVGNLQRRDPVGLNDNLAEEMTAKVRASCKSALGDRPHILLSLISTLPSYRGIGVASQHLKWATQVADNAKLPIWLDASPMSVSLYTKFGFVVVGEVESDLSVGSKGSENGTYVHTCMLREPSERER